MTDMVLPEPLVPEECDLRGYEHMKLFGHKLFKSTLYTKGLRNHRALIAAIKLMWEAWQSQVPAGSLPDDDDELALLADFGIDVEGWQAAKELALHGWIKCSDGRLYHPLLAEDAIHSYEGRRRDRERKRAQRAAKKRKADGDIHHLSETCPPDIRSESERERDIYQSKDWPTASPQARGFAFAVEDDRVAGPLPDDDGPEPVHTPPAGPAPSPHRSVFAQLPRVVALTGRPERACRGLLGSWRKKLDDDVSALDELLTECERQDVAEPVAWMERAISRTTGQPVAEKHKTPSERVVDEALGRAQRAWSALFEECRNFGWVNRVWPERAAALGLPTCAVTRAAYMAHFAGGVA